MPSTVAASFLQRPSRTPGGHPLPMAPGHPRRDKGYIPPQIKNAGRRPIAPSNLQHQHDVESRPAALLPPPRAAAVGGAAVWQLGGDGCLRRGVRETRQSKTPQPPQIRFSGAFRSFVPASRGKVAAGLTGRYSAKRRGPSAKPSPPLSSRVRDRGYSVFTVPSSQAPASSSTAWASKSIAPSVA